MSYLSFLSAVVSGWVKWLALFTGSIQSAIAWQASCHDYVVRQICVIIRVDIHKWRSHTRTSNVVFDIPLGLVHKHIPQGITLLSRVSRLCREFIEFRRNEEMVIQVWIAKYIGLCCDQSISIQAPHGPGDPLLFQCSDTTRTRGFNGCCKLLSATLDPGMQLHARKRP